MSYAWFRFYSEVVDDPKVQRLPLILFRAWVNLLCIATKHGGVLPEIGDIAYSLHVTESRAKSIIKELMDAELFEKEEGVIRPHNWDGRQFQSDNSTARVKRFRNAHKAVSETVGNDGGATHPDTDTESDTDTEETGNPPKVPPLGGTEKVDLEAAFEPRWERYPNHDGKKQAIRHWNASVKTEADLADFDKALENYEKHIRLTGYKIKNGSTYFNNWRDYIGWQEPPLGGTNGTGREQRESFQERAARENRETADRIHRQLFGSNGDGPRAGDPAGQDLAVLPGPKRSD